MGISAVIQIISLVASVAYQQAQQRKMRAARDARLGQEVRPSGSTEPVPVLYGYTNTGGTTVFVDTGNGNSAVIPAAASTGDRAYQGGLAGTLAGSKNQYLLSQTVLSAGQIDRIEAIDVNGTYMRPGITNDDDATKIYNTSFSRLSTFDDDDSIATSFSTRRAAADTFNGLSYSTTCLLYTSPSPRD